MFPLKKNNTLEISHCNSWYICFSPCSCSVHKISFNFSLKSPKSLYLDLGVHLLRPRVAYVLQHDQKVSIPVFFPNEKLWFSFPLCVYMYFYGLEMELNFYRENQTSEVNGL